MAARVRLSVRQLAARLETPEGAGALLLPPAPPASVSLAALPAGSKAPQKRIPVCQASALLLQRVAARTRQCRARAVHPAGAGARARGRAGANPHAATPTPAHTRR
jgi:hypothetical protein